MPLNSPLADWHGRVAWIVGASTGIGLACARRLHARGARVIVSARRLPALLDVVRELPGTVAIPMDVTQPDSARQAWHGVMSAAGGCPDLLVYCAGHYVAQHAARYDLDEMQRHLDINYGGVLRWLDAVLPALVRAGQGHVSLVGSVAGYRGLPRSLAYGPTKAALNNLAECLYLDLHPHGLGVSVVNPGFVETRLTARNDFPMPALITPDEAAAHMLEGWARGRFEMNFPRRFTRWVRLLRALPDAWYFGAVRRATGA